MILKITPPVLDMLARAETLLHKTCTVKREDALTLGGDETCKDQWGKRVIKHNCESTDNCCSKCINLYCMLAKGC